MVQPWARLGGGYNSSMDMNDEINAEQNSIGAFHVQAFSQPSVEESEDVIRNKVQQLQDKYRTQLHLLFPVIRREYARDPSPVNQLFMQHVRDCFSILHIMKEETIPAHVTLQTLEQSEARMMQIIAIYGNENCTKTKNSETEGLRDSYQQAEQIWTKLQQLQDRYTTQLFQLFPFIRQEEAREPSEQNFTLVANVREALSILYMRRQKKVPEHLTMEKLLKIEEFVQAVVQTYAHKEKGFESGF